MFRCTSWTCLLGFFILFGLSACNLLPCKSCDSGDFIGQGVLRGRLTYTDTFTGSGAEFPLGNRFVNIAESPSDRLNFKYSVKTDKDGYFVFEHLQEDKTYDVFFTDTVGSRRFSAIATSTVTDTPIVLQATVDQTGQNGLAVSLNGPLGAPQANASICVFNSYAQARLDTCTGRLFELPTDLTGRAATYRLAVGKYYLLSKVTIGSTRYRAFDSVTVTSSGIATRSLTLQPYSTRRNGMVVSLRDPQGNPLANTSICVFNNYTLARTDTCTGRLFELRTNISGNADYYNVPAGKYYLLSKTLLGSGRYRALDSITVAPSGIATRTVTLTPYSTRRNGFELTVFDQRNTPVYNTRVCIFRSAIFARVDTCAGSIMERYSDIDGRVAAYNLSPGRYYFRLRAGTGRLRLSGYDSVQVNSSGVTLRNITIR